MADSDARLFEKPSADVLARFSAGTGISVEDLEWRNNADIMQRVFVALNQILQESDVPPLSVLYSIVATDDGA